MDMKYLDTGTCTGHNNRLSEFLQIWSQEGRKSVAQDNHRLCLHSQLQLLKLSKKSFYNKQLNNDIPVRFTALEQYVERLAKEKSNNYCSVPEYTSLLTMTLYFITIYTPFWFTTTTIVWCACGSRIGWTGCSITRISITLHQRNTRWTC